MGNGKLRLLILLSIFFIARPNLALCQISITVAPPLVESSIAAGGLRTFKLVVSNLGNKPVDIEGYTCDLKLNLDGTPLVLEPGLSSYSCAKWIELTNDKFTLDPGSKKEIGAKIRVPRGVRGGRYAVILFESLSSDRTKRGNVILGARLGTILMVSIPWTLKREAEISQIKVEEVPVAPREGGQGKTLIQPVDFIVSLKNMGNVHIQANGSVVIKNDEGRIIDRIPLEVGTGTVLPEGVRDFQGSWSNPRKMVKGKYTAEARINYGGRKQARAEKTFSIE
jgi:hypothetical protein